VDANEINIYRFDDYGDYVAAHSFDEAIEFYCQHSDLSIADVEAVVELDDETMSNLILNASQLPFKTVLKSLIEANDEDEFPMIFAESDEVETVSEV
jgi:hypothetical protein